MQGTLDIGSGLPKEAGAWVVDESGVLAAIG